MSISSIFKSFSPVEIAVLVVFIIYIIFPISTPSQFAFYIDHPFGIVAILTVVVYLFFFTNPVLGVVSLLVVYELLRRSSLLVSRVPIIEYVPSQKKKDAEMILMNPPVYTTLEEEIVGQRAPVDVSRPIVYNDTTFKPIAENIKGASLI